MPPEIRIRFRAVEPDKGTPALGEAQNFVATIIDATLRKEYGSSAIFDGNTGEPLYLGRHMNVDTVKLINHVTVQSPQAMLAILQSDFSGEDEPHITSTMPAFNTADMEDDDEP